MMKYLRGGDAPFYQGISTVRVAPGRGVRPAAGLWKFWVEKDEIYAVSRMGGDDFKFSVHASGQIHMHGGRRNTVSLAPPMVMREGQWRHAFEIRFLLGDGADFPPEGLSELKNEDDKALVVPVPDGHVFYLDLLVSVSAAFPTALPSEMSGAPEIWRTKLRDGRTVVLLGRVMPFDEQSSAVLRQVRSERQLKANFTGPPPPSEIPYIEVVEVHPSIEHGNVVLVVPMGAEGRRFDPDGIEPVDSRTVKVECSDACANLSAPNRSIVGVISIKGLSKELSLVKDKEVVYTIGQVALLIHPEALWWGANFKEQPRVSLECALIAGGVSARSWKYEYALSFDGYTVTVSISKLSTSLRNANQENAIPRIGPSEEILIRAPSATLRLTANRDLVSAAAELTCAFRLRDI